MLSATRLFVGNLPDNTQNDDLLSAFSGFGKITNVDLKCKVDAANDGKKFAFISLSASNMDIESCIKHFSNNDFNGKHLYVTRARESFLERLQRERAETQQQQQQHKQTETLQNSFNELTKNNPVLNLGNKLNPKKRKIDHDEHSENISRKNQTNGHAKLYPDKHSFSAGDYVVIQNTAGPNLEINKKKYEAEQKRVESMKKKRQEFNEKKLIIKNDLKGVDHIQNKKILFDDNDESFVARRNQESTPKVKDSKKKSVLFNDDIEDSGDELNFEVNKQFEGKKGQKVLELQSRYKSDKRFVMSERFIDDDSDEGKADNEEVELSPADEKAKQLNILQDVLGVTLKTKVMDIDGKKTKPKLGMLRFDPMQPDHEKYLAPVERKPEPMKKSKKKNKEKGDIIETQPVIDVPKVEVSKEQFYKVSDTLKEAIAQPNNFSLRSLFGQPDYTDDGPQQQDTDYIPLEVPKDKKKLKNPLDNTNRNPFKYDSSDSETEEPEKEIDNEVAHPSEVKAVWKENLFFSDKDSRLQEGLIFFSKIPQNEIQKERRELKSLVKKRLYNNDRKNKMFKKKIGGRKKSMKKSYRNKN